MGMQGWWEQGALQTALIWEGNGLCVLKKRPSFESFSQGGKMPQTVGTITTANATRIIKSEIKQQNQTKKTPSPSTLPRPNVAL